MAGTLADAGCAAVGAGPVAAKGGTLVCKALCNIEGFLVHIEVVYGVCNRAPENLQGGLGSRLGGVHKDCFCIFNALAADKVDHYLYLAGRNADLFRGRMGTPVSVFLALL